MVNELICVIVNCGTGSKVIGSARRHGLTGATVMIGKGTVNNRFLCFIGLADMRKEVVFMVAGKEEAYAALEKMAGEFEFKKPDHGIAFTMPVCEVAGKHDTVCEYIDTDDEEGRDKGAGSPEDKNMYHNITVIVEKGKGEDVIDAAVKAGSKGGTILNGRGSGIHETSRLFSMNIEPEKEIVMILSEAEFTEAIVSSVREHLAIDEPGNGIIYVQKVNKTYGLYK